jgi:hypothetical protein
MACTEECLAHAIENQSWMNGEHGDEGNVVPNEAVVQAPRGMPEDADTSAWGPLAGGIEAGDRS